MTETFGYALSGARRGQALTGAQLGQACLDPDLAWAHFLTQGTDTGDAQAWLATLLPDLDEPTLRALTGAGTRPRSIVSGQGAVVLLRDVPDGAFEDGGDMPSLRLYIDARMIVSIARRPVGSLQTLAQKVGSGQGPATLGAFLHDLVEIITERIDATVDALTAATDAVEDVLDLGHPSDADRQEVTRLRRAVLGLRRYLAPQRDALDALRQMEVLSKGARRRLAELHDRQVRIVEELDLLVQRLVLAREGIAGAQAERLNRQLYVLSIVSVLFLPLGFLTGLMGVNLGGLPGSDSGLAFWLFCGLLAGIFAVLAAVLWKLRWF
jgi:zinc transporter